MKKLLTLVVFLGACVHLMAQETTAYFLNGREMAPASIYFLNPTDIDSVKVYVSQLSGDSTIIAYTGKEHKILTYDEMLEHFFIEQSAISLPVNTTYYSGVEDPENLVFSIDMISSVQITTDNLEEKGVFLTPIWYSWEPSSEAEDLMVKIKRKLNNISSGR